MAELTGGVNGALVCVCVHLAQSALSAPWWSYLFGISGQLCSLRMTLCMCAGAELQHAAALRDQMNAVDPSKEEVMSFRPVSKFLNCNYVSGKWV